ncbi:extensin family protein [Novosphingobium guangzhouense]|uniref:Extensin n=1 Tax=Novosphingobium guangzhouense TaxID=1850347 RepID=A0A2K2G233_9SPHN|nr:extensin family protein [Novosphingobium guangzhouense]PNU05084.1 extensin [Novosphingobium guangzhouense]
MTLSLFDRIVLVLLLVGTVALMGRAWLHDHPAHDPWAPLSLEDGDGWATGRKLSALRSDLQTCRAFLERSGIPAAMLPAQGTGQCRRDDRKPLSAPARLDVALRPAGAQATCAVDAGLAWWLRNGVEPAAGALLDASVVGIEHLGTVNCRRIGGGDTGSWSEHATGNAIDIAAFVLSDGRRISVARDWQRQDARGTFLRTVRDSACRSFGTVLSPDYNAAHADHLHLDQAHRVGGWSACR